MPSETKSPDLVDKVISHAPTYMGMIAAGILAYAGLASRTYVDQKSEEAKRYTDQAVATAMKSVSDHSDLNFQRMATKQEAQGVKIDMLMELIRDLKDAPKRR